MIASPRAQVRVECVEPKSAFRPRNVILDAAGVSFADLRLALSDFVEVRAATDDVVEFRPGVIAGSAIVNGLRVVVKPRLGSLDLATLVRFAHGADIETLPHSDSALGDVGLDELVGSLFADELDRIRAFGLSRRYVRRDDRPRAVRGAVDFTASFPWRERGMTSVACTYHELSTDVLDNQLLRVALKHIDRLALRPATLASLRGHRRAWRDIAEECAADRSAFARARAGYQRLNRHYALGHTLAEIVVEASSPVDVLHGLARTRGIRLDLARLFEQYVERLAREVFEPLGCVVDDQVSDSGAIVDAEGRRYATIRPDLVVWQAGVPVLVIDAKYKDYGLADTAIGNGDLYQLFFYASRLQAKHRLNCPPLSMIVSPQRGAELVPPSRRRLWLRASEATPQELRLALTELPDSLRSIREGDGRWLRAAAAEFRLHIGQ